MGEVVCVLGATVADVVFVLARKPAIASSNPLFRAYTRYLECGRGCPGSY